MSTVFKNHEGKVVWEHHETFTPEVGTRFEAEGWVYNIKSVTLKVVTDGSGPASITQLKSFVELI